MVKTKGSKDRVKRKYVNSFARQYLADHKVQVFCGDEQVMEPVGQLYNVKLPNTRYYVGEQFIEQGQTRRLHKFEEVRDLGFVVVSVPITNKERWVTGQKVKYELVRVVEASDSLGKIPKDHHVEYDIYNKAARLVGSRAGPRSVGDWILVEKPGNVREGAGDKIKIHNISRNAETLLQKQVMRLRGESEEPKPIYIKEAAFMITNSNEIVCLPSTQDMPSILISGMKGVGKCVLQEKDSDFIIDNKGNLVKIKDKPKKILVLNKDLKLEIAKVNEVMSRKADEVWEVITKRNKKIFVTPNHPFLTVLGWKRARDLKVHDFVATVKNYNFDSGKKISLHKVKFLAYFLSCGKFGKESHVCNVDEEIRLEFHNNDANIMSDVSSVICGFGQNHFMKGRSIRGGNGPRKYLEKLGLFGKNSLDYFIPNEIMGLSKNQINKFLSIFFSVNGYVSLPKQNNGNIISPFINIRCKSETVARQMQHLFLRFGIVGTIRYRKIRGKNAFIVAIVGTESLKKFIKYIKPICKRKIQRLSLLKKFVDCARPSLTHDVIPHDVWKLYTPKDWLPIYKKLGYFFKRSQLNNMDFTITREVGRKIHKATGNSVFKKLVDSDVLWDRIKSIKKVKGCFSVWDVEVDHPFHSFVANDFIIHNSYCLHSIVSRLFWKPLFDYNICILNDSSRETGTWNLPNQDIDQINILKRLNEKPLPLPCVYFHPLVKSEYEKLFLGDVGFDVTIPFKEIVENHKTFLNLKESARYFSKIKEELLDCNTEEEVELLFDNMVLHYNIPVQTANKIRAEFDSLFDSKMTDISTKGQLPWRTSKNPGIKYNPITAAVHSGVLPVLETEFISNYRELLSIYFTYFVGDLFNRQKQDPDFVAEKSELLLVVDEAHNIAQRALKSGADMLLRRCVREGRPRRIGTLLATQKFNELPDVIKDNSTFLICFKNPGEANNIVSQYNMGKNMVNVIKDLAKHECLAYTTEHFIVYDTNGKKRKSKLNEVFVGKTLPPYSMHKRPKGG